MWFWAKGWRVRVSSDENGADKSTSFWEKKLLIYYILVSICIWYYSDLNSENLMEYGLTDSVFCSNTTVSPVVRIIRPVWKALFRRNFLGFYRNQYSLSKFSREFPLFQTGSRCCVHYRWTLQMNAPKIHGQYIKALLSGIIRISDQSIQLLHRKG